ncbi:MAG: hypothetical protein J5611_03780 [Alphaproteobacteria bacterium]|jgi:hypothetical protein|nr:hypothetical protein [Alphaproteobacteria bacterium]
MNKFISGGFFANRSTKIMAAAGALSALCAYLVGESDLFATVQTFAAIGGAYWLHKSKQNKGK